MYHQSNLLYVGFRNAFLLLAFVSRADSAKARVFCV